VFFAFSACRQTTSNSITAEKSIVSELIISDLSHDILESVELLDSPWAINCKYGEALMFDGIDDGILIDTFEINSVSDFTVEAVFNPARGGNFEQRFLHIGEISGPRILFETRSDSATWYFDAYVQTEKQKCTLINPLLFHSLDKWYHVALVCNKGKLATYINGKKELTGSIYPSSETITGKASIGMRQNKVSWFKGAIYKVKISQEPLKPAQFTF
jgi:hypothetical protein